MEKVKCEHASGMSLAYPVCLSLPTTHLMIPPHPTNPYPKITSANNRQPIRIIRFRKKKSSNCFRPVYLVIAVLYLELIWSAIWLLEVVVRIIGGNIYYSIGFVWLFTDALAIYYTDKGVRMKNTNYLLVYVIYKPFDILVHICFVILHAMQIEDMAGLIQQVSKESTAIVLGCAQWFVLIYYRRLIINQHIIKSKRLYSIEPIPRIGKSKEKAWRTFSSAIKLSAPGTIPFRIPRAKVPSGIKY